jgi:MFS family permease
MSNASRVSAARLSVLWFGIQLAWGAIIGVSLQARCIVLAGHAHATESYGWVSATGALAAALTQLIAGPISDAMRRRGNKRLAFYAAGAVGGAAGVLAFYAASDIRGLAIAFAIVQVAFNVVIGPYQAILPDFVETERIGTASGWMAAMQSAGNAAGAVLATLLGNTLLLGAAIALAALAGAAVTVSYARGLPLQAVAREQSLMHGRALVDLFISRGFVYLGFYTLVGYLLFYIGYALPPHFGLNATQGSGICILLFTLVGSAGAALAARPADRLDERLVVAVGGAIVALAVALLAFAHNIVAIPIAIAVAGIGWGVFLCADWAFACRVLPRGALATSMAIWNIAVVGPQMVAPLLVTALLARLGTQSSAAGPRHAFVLASAEILLGALWIWRLPRRLRGN